MTTRAAPPEAALIRLARETAHLKVTEAAALAKISKARWSQVENARETRQGVVKTAIAKPGTVAHMAHVVGLTPERLAGAGVRAEAVTVLREILAQEATRRLAGPAPAPAPPGDSDGEAAVWAIVKQHKPGAAGEELFPSDIDGKVTYEARCWNGLVSENFTIEQIVPVIAWWRQHPLPGGAREHEHTDHRAAS